MSEPTRKSIEAQMRELDRQREVLERQRETIWAAEQRKREAAAGDPQEGDLVVVKYDYGAAKQGSVWLVTGRKHDGDHDIEMASLHQWSGDLGGVDLSALIKVNHPEAAALLKTMYEAREKLTTIVDDATGIYPRFDGYW